MLKYSIQIVGVCVKVCVFSLLGVWKRTKWQHILIRTPDNQIKFVKTSSVSVRLINSPDFGPWRMQKPRNCGTVLGNGCCYPKLLWLGKLKMKERRQTVKGLSESGSLSAWDSRSLTDLPYTLRHTRSPSPPHHDHPPSFSLWAPCCVIHNSPLSLPLCLLPLSWTFPSLLLPDCPLPVSPPFNYLCGVNGLFWLGSSRWVSPH